MQEVKRLKTAVIFKIIIAVVLVPAIVYVTFKFSTLWWQYLIGGVFALTVVISVSNSIRGYQAAFINKILKPLLKTNNLKYFPKDGFDEKTAVQSGLFDFDYDDYYSDNLIIGDDFRLAYVCFTKDEEEEDSDGNVQTTTVTKFSGFLIIIKQDRIVNGFVTVEPSGFHLDDLIPVTYDEKRIKMDNPEFEKIFDVYGSDQVEARYLLDHSYMQKLIELYKKAGSRYFVFVKDLIFTKLEYADFKQNIPVFGEINDKIIHKILYPVEYAVYVKNILNKDRYEG